MTRVRSISRIIIGGSNKPSLRNRKQTNKVPCYCNNCNGKLVARRTKLFHGVGNTKVSNLDSNLANTSSPLNQQPDEAPIPDDLDTELSQTPAIQETQNRQIIDINSGRSMPNIQK